ncbi:MAG TPA: C40 family peptidase [Ferruginibacter sp.]|nr:C40 family peptidase [Ferruginibacter sp.]
MKNLYPVALIPVVFLISCSASKHVTTVIRPNTAVRSTVILKENIPSKSINTKNVAANDVVAFAESLLGYPYKWGGTNTREGFDCSGLITYIFNKFKISVPRVSKDFTNAGQVVSTLECKRGDIILFTGSNPNSGVVGHMGIITKNDRGIIQFIHSASGEGGGVTLAGMNPYFIPRFVKVIRIFNDITPDTANQSK